MQETWTFDFPKTSSPEIQLKSILEDQEKDLGIFLSYYFKNEGAVAEKVKLNGEPEFETPTSGKLTLAFDLVHFNACLAIHDQAREMMDLTFEIDHLAEKVTLTGAFWPSREMDEI